VKTILITGSRGFTGRYLRLQFQQADYRVVGMVTDNPLADGVCCDLTDKTAVLEVLKKIKPDGIIHLAAMSFVAHGDDSAFYHLNTVATLNLLEAVVEAGLQPEKIIIASSANVYGNTASEKISEDCPVNPANHYAASKVAMECLVKNWFDRLPIVITRPFNYTGIGQRKQFLVPKIVSHFCQKKLVIELGNLDVARDFSDVHDIAQSYLNLFESPVNGEIVNLCSGQVTSLAQIIRMMNELAGYEIEVRVNPDFVRANEIKTLGGDNSKLHRLTGFVPTIPLTETLQAMYVAGQTTYQGA